MPINNNNHFDNFYINSVFTRNTNSGFVAIRCTFHTWHCIISSHLLPLPHPHRINRDQPSIGSTVCPVPVHILILPLCTAAASPPPRLLLANAFTSVVGGRVWVCGAGLKFNPSRPWRIILNANRDLINDNEFFIICQLYCLADRAHGQATWHAVTLDVTMDGQTGTTTRPVGIIFSKEVMWRFLRVGKIMDSAWTINVVKRDKCHALLGIRLICDFVH